jgi:hypothetical protein
MEINMNSKIDYSVIRSLYTQKSISDSNNNEINSNLEKYVKKLYSSSKSKTYLNFFQLTSIFDLQAIYSSLSDLNEKLENNNHFKNVKIIFTQEQDIGIYLTNMSNVMVLKNILNELNKITENVKNRLEKFNKQW